MEISGKENFSLRRRRACDILYYLYYLYYFSTQFGNIFSQFETQNSQFGKTFPNLRIFPNLKLFPKLGIFPKLKLPLWATISCNSFSFQFPFLDSRNEMKLPSPRSGVSLMIKKKDSQSSMSSVSLLHS